MAKSRKRTAHSTKSNFSKRHGTKAPTQSVSGEQLGHDQQLPVNPPTPGGSPLMEPGSSPGLGSAAGNNPSGPDYY